MWNAFADKMPTTGRPIFVIDMGKADERAINPETDNADEFDGFVPIYMASCYVAMAKEIGFGVCIFRSKGRDPMAEQLSEFDHLDLMHSGMWCYVADLVRHANAADRVTGDVMTEQDTIEGHIRGEYYVP
jgi:hypothetical protein